MSTNPLPDKIQEKFKRIGWGEWIPTPGIQDESKDIYISDNRHGDHTQHIHMYAMTVEEALSLSDDAFQARLYAIMDNPADAIAEYEQRVKSQ